VFGCGCWPNCAIIIPTNSGLFVVFFDYSNMHKGYKWLDTSTGRIYISRDVVFDEKLFPFAAHQSIVGVQYTSDVLLLPESFSRNNSGTNIDVSPACTVSPLPSSYVQTLEDGDE
jgi:hypothetical protein